MSGVSCQVSGVTCHVSGVRCHVSGVTCIYIYIFFFLQSGEASRWRVCYQRGLPRLVSLVVIYFHPLSPLHPFSPDFTRFHPIVQPVFTHFSPFSQFFTSFTHFHQFPSVFTTFHPISNFQPFLSSSPIFTNVQQFSPHFSRFRPFIPVFFNSVFN